LDLVLVVLVVLQLEDRHQVHRRFLYTHKFALRQS
jgi:hypothetical protein